MILETIVYQSLSIHSYVIADSETRQCAVIDPPRSVWAIQKYINDHGLELVAILETHVHADFISGALELKKAFLDKPLIYASSCAKEEWLPSYADKAVMDGDSLTIGSIILKAVHTPGHTEEHITWLCFESADSKIPVKAFTGDFLFVQGVGRPDLLGEEKKKKLLESLYNSLFVKIAGLPDSLAIFPSHGPGSMCGKSIGEKPSSLLGDERQTSEAFQKQEIQDWASKIITDMPAPPKTFSRNKKINLVGAPLMSTLPEDRVLKNPKEIAPFVESGWIFDFREPPAFGDKHIKNSVNTPFSPAVGNWLAAIFPENEPVLCILPNLDEQGHITELIRVLGYDQPLAFASWDLAQSFDGPFESLEMLDPEQLEELQQTKSDTYVIDVRTPAEWNAGHIADAHHHELNKLEACLESLPKDKHIVTICGSGWRSSLAASFLKKQGFPQVSHVWGGMKAYSLYQRMKSL